MNKISVAICDDSRQICDYIEFICNREDSIDFKGSANSSGECLDLIQAEMPDVLLLDMQIECDNSGVLLIPEILGIKNDIKIIILTVHKEDEYIFEALCEGAVNYILKTCSEEEIIGAIKDATRDNIELSPEVSKAILKQGKEIKRAQKSMLYLVNIVRNLSTSEFEVLKAVYDGKSYKDIAKERVVEEGTIRVQVSRILRKFNVGSMRALVKSLRDLQIFELFK